MSNTDGPEVNARTVEGFFGEDYYEFLGDGRIPMLQITNISDDDSDDSTFRIDIIGSISGYFVIDTELGVTSGTVANSVINFEFFTNTITIIVINFTLSLPSGKIQYKNISLFPIIDQGTGQFISNPQAVNVNSNNITPLVVTNIQTPSMQIINSINNNQTNNVNRRRYDDQFNETDQMLYKYLPSKYKDLLCSHNVEPDVEILATKTSDGKEVSEISAKITDVYKYKICGKILQKKFMGRIIDSTIYFYHPEFSEVILGEGCTFVEKLENLVGRNNRTLINNIARYAIIKYVLATILYNEANLKYLLRDFNRQFIGDLEASRYSVFAPLFTDPCEGFVTMPQYFK